MSGGEGAVRCPSHCDYSFGFAAPTAKKLDWGLP